MNDSPCGNNPLLEAERESAFRSVRVTLLALRAQAAETAPHLTPGLDVALHAVSTHLAACSRGICATGKWDA